MLLSQMIYILVGPQQGWQSDLFLAISAAASGVSNCGITPNISGKPLKINPLSSLQAYQGLFIPKVYKPNGFLRHTGSFYGACRNWDVRCSPQLALSWSVIRKSKSLYVERKQGQAGCYEVGVPNAVGRETVISSLKHIFSFHFQLSHVFKEPLTDSPFHGKQAELTNNFHKLLISS